MTAEVLIAFAAVAFCWAVVSERLAADNVSGPLVFLVAGLLLGNERWGIVTVDVESSTVHMLAEVTLALVLFADASGVPLAAARRDAALTGRLLGIGLPLSILLGTLAAMLVFPVMPVALCGLIAAALAPTDAALSASIISDTRLPERVRRVLNVESGLNDGIATPIVTFCIASTATVLSVVQDEHSSGFGAIAELAVGVAVGAGLAIIGGRLLAIGDRHDWMQQSARRMAALALAFLSFMVASELGGNPFVAAFVGGLVFGSTAPHSAAASVDLADLTGKLLAFIIWFVFGAGFVVPAFEDLNWQIVLYALASLTVIRLVPVGLAWVGAGQDRPTVAFVAWFGPRGLASVVFALLAVEELGASDPRVLTAVHLIAVTIVFSVIVHGVTARPLTRRYLTMVGHQTAP